MIDSPRRQLGALTRTPAGRFGRDWIWRSAYAPAGNEGSPLRSALILLVAAAVIPIGAGVFSLARYELVLTYFLVIVGLNFSFGYAGQLSIAQPVVMGVSAYVAALLNLDHHWNAWETLAPAVASGVAMGVILIIPALRLRGWYLGIAAFFAVLVFPNVLVGTQQWTGGDNGIGPVDEFPGLTSGLRQYEFVLACAAICWLALRNLSNSAWGTQLRAMRESPEAAESLGVNLKLLGLGIAALGSVPVALGGWILVHSTQVVTPDLFGFNLMLILMGAVLLGGRGTLWGPIVGTAVFEGLNLYILPFSQYNQIILGVGVLLAATAFPVGITPILRQFALERLNPDTADGGEGLSSDDAAFPSEPVELIATDDRPAPRNRSSAPSRQPVLSATGIRKAFGGRQVLNAVSAELLAGEICGLVGPNGSGKTTFLNILTGFVRAEGGSLQLAGKPVLGFSPHRLARLGMTRSFQVPQLIPELSARENIRFGLRRLNGKGQRISVVHGPRYRRHRVAEAERVSWAGHLVGLDDHLLDAQVRELSLGTRRLVEIARAGISNPSVICLDEPAAGLGGADLDRLGLALQAIAARGASVLLVEHNLAFVRGLADQLVVFDHGDVVRHERPVDRSGRPAAKLAFAPQVGNDR